MILGHLLDAAGEPLDQVLFVYFPPGGSYTGETIVEFHLHGGPVIVEAALDAMLAGGARIAEPGDSRGAHFCRGGSTCRRPRRSPS
jgi:tRNA modification GTPase